MKKMKREDAQRKNAYTAYKRWNETDVLIIDESMSTLDEGMMMVADRVGVQLV